ncbi:MAG TPA: hypothetical protein VFW87_02475 [Pirellulales bacterium]|nr:hypothetical protein [Pirellulales bacterium]
MKRDVELTVEDSRGNVFLLTGTVRLPPPRRETPPARDVIAVMLGRTPKRLRGWTVEKVHDFYHRYAAGGALPEPTDAERAFADAILAGISRDAQAGAPVTGELHLSGHVRDADPS